jgi:hypothetical protein
MFVKKIQVSISLIMLLAAIHVSEVCASELDSIGRMPEITVTAPRYEYQDEAWAGMVDGVVVEAQRISGGKAVAVKAGLEPYIMFTGSEPLEEINDISMESAGSTYLFLSFVINLALVPLSLIYISLSAYLGTKEVKK